MDFLNLYKDLIGLLPNATIEELMQCSYRYVSMPILATDVTYRVLGIYPKEKTGDPYWDHLLEYGGYETDTMLELYEDGIMQSADQHEEPYLVDWGRAAGQFPKIVAVIRTQGHTQGFISLLCGERACSEEIMEAVKIIQKIGSLLYQNCQSKINLHSMLQKAFVQELLSGKIATQDQLEQWLHTTGIQLNKAFSICVITTGQGEEETVLANLYQELERMFPFQLSLIQKEKLYVLRFCVTDDDNERKRLTSFCALLERFHCRCGMSDCFVDLLSIKAQIKQAQTALTLGAACDEDHSLYHYKDYALLALLRYGAVQMPAHGLYHPMLATIKQYDQKHHSELYETLECWIRCLGDSSMITEKLHIHRNSLIYRIHKIESLTQCLLSDFETLLHLAASFYLIEKEKGKGKK